jgi:hypothetical protein
MSAIQFFGRRIGAALFLPGIIITLAINQFNMDNPDINVTDKSITKSIIIKSVEHYYAEHKQK